MSTHALWRCNVARRSPMHARARARGRLRYSLRLKYVITFVITMMRIARSMQRSRGISANLDRFPRQAICASKFERECVLATLRTDANFTERSRSATESTTSRLPAHSMDVNESVITVAGGGGGGVEEPRWMPNSSQSFAVLATDTRNPPFAFGRPRVRTRACARASNVAERINPFSSRAT